MTVLSKRLPNVLILTDGCISQAHGTGAVLLRHFESYPPKRLLNVFRYYEGWPRWRRSLLVNEDKSLHERPMVLQLPFLARKLRSVLRRSGLGYWYAKPDRLVERLTALRCEPDVIYSNVFSGEGLQMLLGLINHYGSQVPVIQHFHDLNSGGSPEFWDTVDSALRKVCEIWAVTDSIAEEVRAQTGCPVDVISTFRCRIPPGFKRQHREINEGCRMVMLGNIWQPATISAINAVWPQVVRRFDKMQPIEWACHPSAVDRLLQGTGVTLAPAIRPVGFIPEGRLHSWLCDADLAIVPVSCQAHADHDYARYSLPSRITNLACAGLPMFFLASEGTETFKFVKKTGIGKCSPAMNETELADDLIAMMENQHLRALCGSRARAYAEEHFDLAEYQRWLYGKLAGAVVVRGPS